MSQRQHKSDEKAVSHDKKIEELKHQFRKIFIKYFKSEPAISAELITPAFEKQLTEFAKARLHSIENPHHFGDAEAYANLLDEIKLIVSGQLLAELGPEYNVYFSLLDVDKKLDQVVSPDSETFSEKYERFIQFLTDKHLIEQTIQEVKDELGEKFSKYFSLPEVQKKIAELKELNSDNFHTAKDVLTEYVLELKFLNDTGLTKESINSNRKLLIQFKTVIQAEIDFIEKKAAYDKLVLSKAKLPVLMTPKTKLDAAEKNVNEEMQKLKNLISENKLSGQQTRLFSSAPQLATQQHEFKTKKAGKS